MPSETEIAVPHHHVVQFYGANGGPLVRNVGAYLARGLAAGGGAIVIAGPDHRHAFADTLGGIATDAVSAGRLELLDAADMLDRFMVAGEPHQGRFDATVGAAVRALAREHCADGVSAFGEMVGLLWQGGNRTGAVKLEHLWNGLLGRHDFSLYCAYPVDVLDTEFRHDALDGVLAAHSDVVDTGTPGKLGNAVTRALDDVLGTSADGLRQLMRTGTFHDAWAALPEGEASVLWLRRNLPERADEVLARARLYFA